MQLSLLEYNRSQFIHQASVKGEYISIFSIQSERLTEKTDIVKRQPKVAEIFFGTGYSKFANGDELWKLKLRTSSSENAN